MKERNATNSRGLNNFVLACSALVRPVGGSFTCPPVTVLELLHSWGTCVLEKRVCLDQVDARCMRLRPHVRAFVSSAVHATSLCHFSHSAAMAFEVYTPSEFGCVICKVAFRRWPEAHRQDPGQRKRLSVSVK